VICGVGLTVIVNEVVVPEQPFSVGVTVTVPTIFAPVLFGAAVKFVICVLPVAPKPVAIFVFVQAKVAPVGVEIQSSGLTKSPEQTVMFAGVETLGFGLTVIVKLVGLPIQLFKVGITAILVTKSVVPEFVAVNEILLVFPFAAANPTAEFEFVHIKDEPVGVLANVVFTASPGQYASDAIELTVGFGRTVTVKFVTRVQPFVFVAVTVNEPVKFAAVAFVAVKSGT
jgi:hypothetical protein